MQKKQKITETLANGYSSERTQRELPNEYQDDRVLVVFQESCILVLWTKVVSALEGLRSMTNNGFSQLHPSLPLINYYVCIGS